MLPSDEMSTAGKYGAVAQLSIDAGSERKAKLEKRRANPVSSKHLRGVARCNILSRLFLWSATGMLTHTFTVYMYYLIW